MLAGVEEAGLVDTTVLMFVGDHGYQVTGPGPSQ